MNCPAKHVKKPIPVDDWKCPRCGTGPEDFYIQDDPEDAGEDCPLEHEAAYVICQNCGYGATMKTITAKYWKAKNIEWVKCPCCHGTGMIDKRSVSK